MIHQTRKLLLIFLAVLPLSYCTTVSQEEKVEEWYKSQEPFLEEIKQQNAALIAEAQKSKIGEPFFWRVSKDDKESWLLGSVHQGVSLSLLPWRVHQEIEEAERFLFESDMDDPKNQLFERVFRQNLNKGQSLESQLDGKAWNVFTTDLAPFPDEYLDILEPKHAYFLYTSFLTQALLPSKDFMDYQLYVKIKEGKKSVGYLETIDEITLDALFTEKTKAKELNDFLLHEPKKEVGKEIVKIYEMILAYKRGNSASLTKLFEEEGAGDLYQSLVVERNALWMKKLKTEMAQGNRFVTVGVGHMLGKASLLQLLEKEGFKVERWTSAAAF